MRFAVRITRGRRFDGFQRRSLDPAPEIRGQSGATIPVRAPRRRSAQPGRIAARRDRLSQNVAPQRLMKYPSRRRAGTSAAMGIDEKP
jgi:hypothetical protein